MCGIIGYVGPRAAKPLLLQGLERLEYRGYDSAGIAVGCGPNGSSNVADIAIGASAQGGGSSAKPTAGSSIGSVIIG